MKRPGRTVMIKQLEIEEQKARPSIRHVSDGKEATVSNTWKSGSDKIM